uniref:AraC family transcriptional regulator n=1 Tax=Fundidesulfovibrio putealis TaxID=270496 RepID=A0A7C4AG91_9BACT
MAGPRPWGPDVARAAGRQGADARHRVWRDPGLDGVELLLARGQRTHFARHFHQGYALGVLESGGLRFRYLGRDCLAQPGELNMVVPGEVHDGRPASDPGFGYRMLYLSPQAVARAAGALYSPDQAPDFAAGVLDNPPLAQALTSLHRALEAGETSLLERQSRLEALLCAWIARHAQGGHAQSRARQPGLTGAEPRAVRLARHYLDEHFARPVPLEELARATGLSGTHLNRQFSRALGLPPHAYQVQLRVERARALLASGSGPADAALEAGFADQSHLNRHFRRLTGVTPGAYAKIVQDR